MDLILGIDNLIASGQLEGHKVGVLCNPASVDQELRHTVDRIWAAPRVTLVGIFGPQHGFNSDAQDNMVETPHGKHPRYGVPIYSLYSDTRIPSEQMFKKMDILVIDLQDVGTRVYTYIHTMANCLRAASTHRVQVVVCDRPNPITGTIMEGPVLQTGYESFVGQFPIPMRHGMTIGELAGLFNDQFGLRADLTVSRLKGWVRTIYADQNPVPWIMPSPNLPTLDSATVYPGAVLIEGTNLSEGRGTTRPFELVGAPWLRGEKVSDQLNQMSLPGVHFRPVRFEPTFHKYARQPCEGCQTHITDRRSFNPILAMVALLEVCRRSSPEQFAWRSPPYEYEQVKLPIDILYGSNDLRSQIEAGVPAIEIASRWASNLAAFAEIRDKFLLY